MMERKSGFPKDPYRRPAFTHIRYARARFFIQCLSYLLAITAPVTLPGCASAPPVSDSRPTSQSPTTSNAVEASIGAEIEANRGDKGFHLGRWVLNRERTVELLYRNKGVDFNRLSRIDRQRALRNFQFDLSIEFTDDMRWSGSYSNGPEQGGGQGRYVIQGSTEGALQIRVSEESESGEPVEEGFLDSLTIQPLDVDEIVLRLIGKEESQRLDLVMIREESIRTENR